MTDSKTDWGGTEYTFCGGIQADIWRTANGHIVEETGTDEN